jgi:diguanylate cyclase (GGDEF)-like protein
MRLPDHRASTPRRRATPRRQIAALQAELASCRAALQACQARERQARALAGSDALTGLPNRRAFAGRVGQAIEAHHRLAQGFCLLFIDLDGFKAINDSLGHAAGDAVLQLVGARLVHGLRSVDRVSRHGGDEFVCLLPQVQQPAQALAIARTLTERIAAPCSLGPLKLQVQASVGAALFPQHGLTLADLMHSADVAMLRAKQQRQGPVLALTAPAGPGAAGGVQLAM